MVYPTINLNGTNAQALYDQYTAAQTTLEAAYAAMRGIETHGRDYPQTRASSSQASEAYRDHIVRCKAIADIINDYTAIRIHLVNTSGEASWSKIDT